MIEAVSSFRTDLNKLDAKEQKILINTGYVMSSLDLHVRSFHLLSRLVCSDTERKNLLTGFRWPYEEEDITKPEMIVKGIRNDFYKN